jgi:cupin 2 domain-containing protein
VVTERQNIFAALPAVATAEQLDVLLSAPNVRIERIVSAGHATPPGQWYDQDWAEWVLVVQGSAALLIEGEGAARRLGPGDFVHIPPHVRHRVEWTDPAQPTLWLAVHFR